MNRVNNNTVDKFGRGKRPQNERILRGPLGIGFKLTVDEQYDSGAKSVTNLGEAINDSDAITKIFVTKELYNLGKKFSQVMNQEIMPLVRKLDSSTV